MVALDNHMPSFLFPCPPDLEVVTISINSRKHLTLSAVYSPPNASVSVMTITYVLLSAAVQ